MTSRLAGNRAPARTSARPAARTVAGVIASRRSRVPGPVAFAVVDASERTGSYTVVDVIEQPEAPSIADAMGLAEEFTVVDIVGPTAVPAGANARKPAEVLTTVDVMRPAEVPTIVEVVRRREARTVVKTMRPAEVPTIVDVVGPTVAPTIVEAMEQAGALVVDVVRPREMHTFIDVMEPTEAPTIVDLVEAIEVPTMVDFVEAIEVPTIVDLVEPQPGAAFAQGGVGLAPCAAPRFARGSAPVLPDLTSGIERDVFQLARRVALQADLPAAMRVLHHGLSRLTASPEALCIFFDSASCSAWAMPDGEPAYVLDPHVQQLVARVAGSGERAVLERAVVEPIGPAPARAVLMIRRAPTGAAYGSSEIATVGAVAASVAGLVGHFAADHGARREQEQRDARSPFRREALAARRGTLAAPGRLVAPPRTWMRWAYPALIGLVVAVLLTAAIIEVPTYSTGISIITMEGEQITSPMPGTVAEVLVAPGVHVAIGDPVLRLRALAEDAELAATETDHRNALATFLTTPRDEGARNALAATATRRQRAQAAVDARTLRAPAAGVVGDIRVRAGQLVTPGAQVMKISSSGAPSVVALLPGHDRPRLALGMTLQIELPGYHKRREEAVIDAIGSQVIGPEEARRSLGDPIGDALPIAGSVVIVHAHLTARTFEAGGREYAFHDGMLGKAEVRVDRDSLLRVLLPGKDP